MSTEKPNGFLRSAYRRNVANLAPLIGVDAARLAVTANNWLALATFLGFFLFLPMVTWAQLGATPFIWIPAILVGAAVVGALVNAGRAGQGSGACASDFVSRRLGYRVRLVGGSWRPSVWQARIDRAQRRDLRNG